MRTAKTCSSDGLSSRWTSGAISLWLGVGVVLGTVFLLLFNGPAFINQDFRAFYAAGQMVLHCPSQLYDLATQQRWQHAAAGGSLELPFYHPAYEALLYTPLTLFPFKTAYLIYAACNMLLLWFCYVVSPAGRSPFAGSRRPLVFFLGFPLLLTIFVGQNSLLMLLALCLAYNALVDDDDRRAGLILGLITFKLATIVPLALLLSIRRGRGFAKGFLVTSAICILASISLTGIGGTRDLLHLLSGATLAASHSVESQRHAAVWLHAMPNLKGLLYLCGTGHLSAHAAFAVNIAATLLLLGGCAYIQRRAASDSLAFSAAITCAVLVSPHLYIYDFAALVLPMLLLAHRALKYVAVLWFLLPPTLYVYGLLTWFAPAVVIPLALLAICIVEFRQEADNITAAQYAAPAYS